MTLGRYSMNLNWMVRILVGIRNVPRGCITRYYMTTENQTMQIQMTTSGLTSSTDTATWWMESVQIWVLSKVTFRPFRYENQRQRAILFSQPSEGIHSNISNVSSTTFECFKVIRISQRVFGGLEKGRVFLVRYNRIKHALHGYGEPAGCPWA